jgi:hypothetical protein
VNSLIQWNYTSNSSLIDSSRDSTLSRRNWRRGKSFIYIEDDEEEEGIVEEIQEGAHVHEDEHTQAGEGEGEHGESAVACMTRANR